MVLIETALSFGHDPKALAINRMTIARSRQKARATSVQSIQRGFRTNEPPSVNWDGKLLKNLTVK